MAFVFRQVAGTESLNGRIRVATEKGFSSASFDPMTLVFTSRYDLPARPTNSDGLCFIKCFRVSKILACIQVIYIR